MTHGGLRGDFKDRSAARHRAAWRRPESHRITPAAPCADLYQQLLFKDVNRRGVPTPISTLSYPDYAAGKKTIEAKQ